MSADKPACAAHPKPDEFITPGPTSKARSLAVKYCAGCPQRADGRCEQRRGPAMTGVWAGWLYPAKRYDGSPTEPVDLLEAS